MSPGPGKGKQIIKTKGTGDMKKLRQHFLLAIVIFWIVTITPFLEKNKVEHYEQLNSLAFGWPIDFIIQDQSSFNPPEYPFAFHCFTFRTSDQDRMEQFFLLLDHSLPHSFTWTVAFKHIYPIA